MKKLVSLFLAVFSLTGAASETNTKQGTIPAKKVSVYGNIDLLSSHVWRGGKSGNAPSIEPLLEFSIGSFTAGTWAAATLDNKYKELDLYISYQVRDFSITLFDYYCPPERLSEAEFSNFKGTETYHLYSTDIKFHGNKKIPITFTASTMLYGMDFNTETSDFYFSTYLETSYSKNWKNNSVSATLGMTTHEGIYANKAAIINSKISYTKTFGFKKFDLPVFTRLIYNPYSGKGYFVGGISINSFLRS